MTLKIVNMTLLLALQQTFYRLVVAGFSAYRSHTWNFKKHTMMCVCHTYSL